MGNNEGNSGAVYFGMDHSGIFSALRGIFGKRGNAQDKATPIYPSDIEVSDFDIESLRRALASIEHRGPSTISRISSPILPPQACNPGADAV